MSSPFLHGHFLLETDTARRLYHDCAAPLPIVDFHSHISARDLAQDRTFGDLVELWFTPDQYKHRALRALGVAERFITGDAPAAEKFAHWAAAVPHTLGNPLFHWTALELKNYFGITTALTPAAADAIWREANAALRQPTHSARALLTRANVALVCTSDRLLDDLSDHAALARSDFSSRVIPSLRADDALAVEAVEFPAWTQQLGRACNTDTLSLDGLLHALEARLDAFAALGCTISDHGIDVLDYVSTTQAEAAPLYARRIGGEGRGHNGGGNDSSLNRDEAARLRSFLLGFLARSYARRGWIMQLHLGAQRHTSSRLRRIAGPAGGYATIGRPTDIDRLCRLLDDLETAAALPRTILYPLNPVDYAAFATLTGSFTREGVAAQIQFGPAWWFNDHELGIRTQLETLAQHGLLWSFIGMTTDSRSLLSMSRHEYFRRLLCNFIGAQVARGAFPRDDALLTEYVRRICHENARVALALPAPSPSS